MSQIDEQFDEQFDILKRICFRGKKHFRKVEDSLGVDMFDHLETEIGYLRDMVNSNKKVSTSETKELTSWTTSVD